MIGLLWSQITPESQWLKRKTCYLSLVPIASHLGFCSMSPAFKAWDDQQPFPWTGLIIIRAGWLNTSNFILLLESEVLCFHLQITCWNFSHNSTNHKVSRKCSPNLCPKGRRMEAFGKPEEWLPGKYDPKKATIARLAPNKTTLRQKHS